jgi:AraC family transcriptional regulator
MLRGCCTGAREELLAKIAVELHRALTNRAVNGTPGRVTEHRIAQGEGWTVSDAVCTCDRRDRPFEERHKGFSIALVAAGSFQYRSSIGRSASRSRVGRELMTPGSVLFGNPGQAYDCGHEHGAGDRCVSFWYAPDYFENLAADAGAPGGKLEFRALRLPPLRELSPLVVRACAGLTRKAPEAPTPVQAEVFWEELSLQLAAQTLRLLGSERFSSGANNAPPSAVARVTRALRMIERHPDTELNLATLAREAGLSPYHFLRTFERLTGATPHQYLLRARLRQAAMRLALGPGKILNIALDCGFGDVSNFNRAFRAEFGINPARFRNQAQARGRSRS